MTLLGAQFSSFPLLGIFYSRQEYLSQPKVYEIFAILHFEQRKQKLRQGCALYFFAVITNGQQDSDQNIDKNKAVCKKVYYRRDPLIGDFFVSQFSQKSPNSGFFQFCRSLMKI